MTAECKQIIEDQTTPDALLVAQESAIVRMYLNGTVEDVVGDKDNTGYEITEYIYHSLVTRILQQVAIEVFATLSEKIYQNCIT